MSSGWKAAFARLPGQWHRIDRQATRSPGDASSATAAPLDDELPLRAELFSADQMASLYVDEAGYVDAVRQSAEKAVAEGFLLQVDADAIIAWAPQPWRSQVGGG